MGMYLTCSHGWQPPVWIKLLFSLIPFQPFPMMVHIIVMNISLELSIIPCNIDNVLYIEVSVSTVYYV